MVLAAPSCALGVASTALALLFKLRSAASGASPPLHALVMQRTRVLRPYWCWQGDWRPFEGSELPWLVAGKAVREKGLPTPSLQVFSACFSLQRQDTMYQGRWA